MSIFVKKFVSDLFASIDDICSPSLNFIATKVVNPFVNTVWDLATYAAGEIIKPFIVVAAFLSKVPAYKPKKVKKPSNAVLWVLGTYGLGALVFFGMYLHVMYSSGFFTEVYNYVMGG